MNSFIAFDSKKPQVHPSAFVATGAILIGQVEIAEEASVWFNCVLRGDILPIKIGRRSNIQDLSLCHTSTGRVPTLVGEEVTVGHRVILHGCELKNRVLIGMGSIVMDHAVVGENSIVGAGSVVTENTIIPPRVLALGSPCKVKRDLTPQEIQFLELSALSYAKKAAEYLKLKL
ncbi:MAG: gamma carbonic anhydrase family protein [Deltaproteobacteria bacterium]|nr:gamma carbonic anhydrase family protein [Deltaproteobacteria bacterium]